MPTYLWLDELPAEARGLRPLTLDHLRVPARRIPTVGLLGRAGATPAGAVTWEPRQVPIACFLPSATPVARRLQLDAIAADLAGTFSVRVNDALERELLGILTGLDGNPVRPRLTRPNALPDFLILCPDPIWRDTVEQQTAAIGGAAAVIPCGSHPHLGRTWVQDAASSRTLTLRNGRGESLRTLTLTGTLTAGQYLEVDHELQTVTRIDGLTRTDVTDTWAPADAAYFVFDPADRPRLQHGGTGDLVHFYRRRWLV